MRINKFLAQSGIASRRHAEILIKEGKVSVNASIVTDLATQINDNDCVCVNGEQIHAINDKKYYAFNKPIGCVTTKSDDRNRKTVMDYIKDKTLFPIGRLDYNTSGLLLFTNDGDIANALVHPRYEIKKTYIAKIKGVFTNNEAEVLRKGVMLDDRKTGKCEIKILGIETNSKSHKLTNVQISIYEGRNRQIRRMFECVNCLVAELKRISIGEIFLDNLKTGQTRPLTKNELAYLRSITNHKLQ